MRAGVLVCLVKLSLLGISPSAALSSGLDDVAKEAERMVKMDNASRVLNGVKKNYDKRLRPFFGGKPVVVYVDLHVVNIGEISVRNMDYALMIYYRQTWNDPRLKNDLDENLVIQGDMLSDIWIPDTYFTNEKTSLVHQVTKENYLLILMPNGTVFFSLRISITAICPMDLRQYPMDSQVCKLDIMSYAGSVNDLRLKWKFGETGSVSMDKDIRLPQMDLIHVIGNEYEEVFPSGTYSRLSLTFRFKRRLNLFITETYLPLVLIVALSWVSFWINYRAAPARVALCITTVLTMITLSGVVRASLPKVTYTKYSDYILIVGLLYVFAALVEYAIVNYYDNVKEKQKQDKINDVEMTKIDMDDGEVDTIISTSHPKGFIAKLKRWLNTDDIQVDSIDIKCRFLFPGSFVLINVIFWIYFAVDSS